MSDRSDSIRGATAAAQLVRTASRDVAARDLAEAAARLAGTQRMLDDARAATEAARADVEALALRTGTHDARSLFDRQAAEAFVSRCLERQQAAAREVAAAVGRHHEARVRLDQAERDLKVIERIDERFAARAQVENRRSRERSDD